MRSEASKSFQHGFTISEQELRRLHDQMCTQIGAIAREGGFTTEFELRFRNGVISNPTSLDEILSQENIGSAAIRRLDIVVRGNGDPNRIFVQFLKTDEGDSDKDDRPIRYRVEGDDRDWVFVTSSQLEERIGRIRTHNLSWSLSRSFVILTAYMLFLSLFILSSSDSSQSQLTRLAELESMWKAGDISDIAAVLFAIERLHIDRQSLIGGWQSIIPAALASFGIVVFLLSVPRIMRFLWPPYNFLWGDYIRTYEGRKSIRNFVLVIVVLGVVLGVVANFVYSFLIK